MSELGKNDFYFDSLEIIENFLYLMAKKEREIRELYKMLEESDGREEKRPVGTHSKLGSLKKRKAFTAMVADPMAVMRVRLKKILSENAGCVVVAEASTCKELLSAYSIHKPSLLVSDIELPTIGEGYKALKEIKTSYPNATIIVVSSNIADVTLLRVMEIGAFDFILKPVNHMRLVNNVEKIRQGDN